MEKLKALWSCVDSQVRQSPWVSLVVTCFSCSAVLIFGLFFVKHGNIPEGARKLSWELVSVFFQGGLAGLIVLYFTQKYQKNREEATRREECRTHVLLILSELDFHIHLCKRLLKGDSVYDAKVFLSREEWDHSKSHIAGIDYEVLRELVAHYQSLPAMTYGDYVCDGKDPVSKIFLERTLLRSVALNNALNAVVTPERASEFMENFHNGINQLKAYEILDPSANA